MISNVRLSPCVWINDSIKKEFFFSDNKNMKCVYVCAFVQDRERKGASLLLLLLDKLHMSLVQQYTDSKK